MLMSERDQGLSGGSTFGCPASANCAGLNFAAHAFITGFMSSPRPLRACFSLQPAAGSALLIGSPRAICSAASLSFDHGSLCGTWAIILAFAGEQSRAPKIAKGAKGSIIPALVKSANPELTSKSKP